MQRTPDPDGPSTGRVHVDIRDSVATVRIDRPPANAVDPRLIAEMLGALPPLVTDPSVRCIVIRGTGRFFVAGADIAVMRSLDEATQRAMRGWVDVQNVLAAAPKPVVAAINGHALGGGAELALACDTRIMSSSATIGFPETSLGLFPGAGGSQRLPRLLGAHRALLLMIDGTRLDAESARAMGLVDRVLSDDEFDAAVADTAASYAAKPTAAIGLLKSVVARGTALPLDDALDLEFDAVLRLIETDDAAEGLSAFLDKRTPHFTGR